MKIRLATNNDAHDILSVYSYYILNSPMTFEYIVPSIFEFEHRIDNVNYPYLVCEIDNKIVGFAYASAHMSRPAYSWNAVLTIYIDKDYHKKGIGKTLYNKLISILLNQNIKNLYGCITSINTNSIKMHQSLGFKILGVFHNTGFKDGIWHDVTWVEKSLYNHNPNDFIPFNKLDPQIVKNILEKC